ncbi:SoxY-related AACIE arm protein [uncultured Ramlibacter sp.]|uniref:SoxY-related AACIE arm protein n=1 Tax=uncultured Ramlibacter sp. TaxID=260755 RepID=UPI0026358899|nr:SoxY-related AACIE arm protein [uncultured Ramlibacter sp.]
MAASRPLLTRRRELLAWGTAMVLATPARSQDAPELAAALAAYSGGALIQRGRVRLEVAKLVDNGNVVPVSVSVDSPMTAADHVAAIAIYNERNPQREVAKFTLGPRAGKAAVATRVRLATSQKLVAVARMSDGSFWSDSMDVVVVLAACIEGDP